MSRNRHKNKNSSNHPKPLKTLIDAKSSYSPNSIGGRIDLQSLMQKLAFDEQTKSKNQTKKPNESETTKKGIQGKGKKE